MTKTKVIEELKTPLAVEEITNAIIQIAKAMRAVADTRMRRDTLVVLLHDRCKISKRDINKVLDALRDLEIHNLKPAAIDPGNVMRQIGNPDKVVRQLAGHGK